MSANTNLIPLLETTINNEAIKTVNARDLHEFLEIGKDFSDWIKKRIEQYDFIEGQDFTTIWGKSTGGRPTSDYHITLDMAKELSMVERNEKGKEARQYFIECEKELKAAVKSLPAKFETTANILCKLISVANKTKNPQHLEILNRQIELASGQQIERAQPDLPFNESTAQKEG